MGGLKMKQQHIGPHGEICKSVKQYLALWDGMTKPFAKALDVQIIGFDPGVLYSSGRQSFNLPVDVLDKFNKLIESKS